jgi:hypothetical protein
MEREVIPTENKDTKYIWSIGVSSEGNYQEFWVHANEIDVAIYEVLTAKDFTKSMITSIARY